MAFEGEHKDRLCLVQHASWSTAHVLTWNILTFRENFAPLNIKCKLLPVYFFSFCCEIMFTVLLDDIGELRSVMITYGVDCELIFIG